MRFYNTNIKISAVRSLADICFLHVSYPDELIVLVIAYELFDINRVFTVVVLPSGRTLRTTTSLNFLSLYIFYFLLLICFFVIYSFKVFNLHQLIVSDNRPIPLFYP